MEKKVGKKLFENAKGRVVTIKQDTNSFRFFNKGHEVKPTSLFKYARTRQVKDKGNKWIENSRTVEKETKNLLNYFKTKEVFCKSGNYKTENAWMRG